MRKALYSSACLYYLTRVRLRLRSVLSRRVRRLSGTLGAGGARESLPGATLGRRGGALRPVLGVRRTPLEAASMVRPGRLGGRGGPRCPGCMRRRRRRQCVGGVVRGGRGGSLSSPPITRQAQRAVQRGTWRQARDPLLCPSLLPVSVRRGDGRSPPPILPPLGWDGHLVRVRVRVRA